MLSSEKPEGYMGMDLVKDKAVKLLAAELWNMAGKENVYHSKDLRQVLQKMLYIARIFLLLQKIKMHRFILYIVR